MGDGAVTDDVAAALIRKIRLEAERRVYEIADEVDQEYRRLSKPKRSGALIDRGLDAEVQELPDPSKLRIHFTVAAETDAVPYGAWQNEGTEGPITSTREGGWMHWIDEFSELYRGEWFRQAVRGTSKHIGWWDRWVRGPQLRAAVRRGFERPLR